MRPCASYHNEPKPETCHLCWLFVSNSDYRRLWGGEGPVANIARPAIAPIVETPKPMPIHGPGTELKALFDALGIKPANGCQCNTRAAVMNGWGVAGCREHRAEIIGWMREALAATDWLTVASAAARAVASGLAFSLSLLDPIGSLVDEAIRRAEKS